MNQPGKNTRDLVMLPAPRTYRMVKNFIRSAPAGPIADIGELNAKSIYLSNTFKAPITQVNCDDFNYPNFKGRYMTVFAFEVIEHVQNPLSFMRAIRDITLPEGTIYLSTPNRFHFMWSSSHFIEMSPAHLNKWILSPLGLTCIRKKQVSVGVNWTWRHFFGIRPLLRLPFVLFSRTWIYEIKRCL